MKTFTDEDLMTDVFQGNLDTMSFLFERYHLRIFNYLHKMCSDRGLSEDLTQEVFYKVIKHRNSYNGGKFSAWIYTIAKNSLANYYRRQKENFENLDDVSHKVSDEQEELNIEGINYLNSVLNKLKPQDKELIVLNKLQGIRYEELAEITGSSEGAVKVKVHRVLKKLKEFYFQTT